MPTPRPIIKSIELSNFKCFQKVATDFSKITLLTGANNSGKSSLIYSILAALQTDNFPVNLSPNGQYVNMGDFEEFVYKHKTHSAIGINMKVLNESQQEIELISEWSKDSKNNMPMLKKLEILSEKAHLSITKNKQYNMSFTFGGAQEYRLVSQTKIDRSKPSDPVLQEIEKFVITAYFDLSQKKYKNSDQARKQFMKIMKASNLRFRNFNEMYKKKDIRYFKAHTIIASIRTLLSMMNDNLNFISSFRVLPERTYYKEVIYDKKIGKYGENFVQQIVEWENQKSVHFSKLNEILRSLGIIYEIKSKRFKGGRIELRAKATSRSVQTSILDVGFGVSQLLPILVADLQLPAGSTLIISQPEIHLHPSAQASFADYIVKNVNEKKKRYIIETHSEYLINRLRLNITKKKIKSEEIKTYYFQNTNEGSIIHDIEFTQKGEIKNAPKNFFDTYMIDVMNIAMES